jgi:hypothetical protein
VRAELRLRLQSPHRLAIALGLALSLCGLEVDQKLVAPAHVVQNGQPRKVELADDLRRQGRRLVHAVGALVCFFLCHGIIRVLLARPDVLAIKVRRVPAVLEVRDEVLLLVDREGLDALAEPPQGRQGEDGIALPGCKLVAPARHRKRRQVPEQIPLDVIALLAVAVDREYIWQPLGAVSQLIHCNAKMVVRGGGPAGYRRRRALGATTGSGRTRRDRRLRGLVAHVVAIRHSARGDSGRGSA